MLCRSQDSGVSNGLDTGFLGMWTGILATTRSLWSGCARCWCRTVGKSRKLWDTSMKWSGHRPAGIWYNDAMKFHFRRWIIPLKHSWHIASKNHFLLWRGNLLLSHFSPSCRFFNDGIQVSLGTEYVPYSSILPCNSCWTNLRENWYSHVKPTAVTKVCLKGWHASATCSGSSFGHDLKSHNHSGTASAGRDQDPTQRNLS